MSPEIAEGLKTGVLLTSFQIGIIKDCTPRSVCRAMERGALPGFKVARENAVRGYIWVAYEADVIAWVPRPAGRPPIRPRREHNAPPRFVNCPAERPGPSEKDIAKGRALFAAREAQRAEYAAKVPEKPKPRFGDCRPALWPGMM